MFRGLLAYTPTPTDDEGNIDEASLGLLLDRVVAAGVDAIGLLGSTGGYAYLTHEQRRRTVQIAVERVDRRVPIVVGVGALATRDAVALARDAGADGADGLLLAPISYLPLTDEEVFRHFAAVAQAGELPLCIYDNPTATKFVFSDDLIARVAELPNVAGIKLPLTADGDYAGELERLRARTPPGFALGYSGDWGAAGALQAGCDAWHSVVAGLLPREALRLARAARTGDPALTNQLDSGFRPLWTLFQAHGSFRVMYALADDLGVGRLRPPRPILPLPDDVRTRVGAALHVLQTACGTIRQSTRSPAGDRDEP